MRAESDSDARREEDTKSRKLNENFPRMSGPESKSSRDAGL